jgi:hypothetical protein
MVPERPPICRRVIRQACNSDGKSKTEMVAGEWDGLSGAGPSGTKRLFIFKLLE